MPLWPPFPERDIEHEIGAGLHFSAFLPGGVLAGYFSVALSDRIVWESKERDDAAAASATKSVVTIPMQLELNSPCMDVTLVGPNGHTAQAHAVVDTGGGAFMLTAGLAWQLGLKHFGKVRHVHGHAMARVAAPGLRIDGKTLTSSVG